jgi:hypothetical protein
VSYTRTRKASDQKATTNIFHSMTRQDVMDTCAERGGVHIIMTAQGYDVIYECAAMAQTTLKAEAVAAAHALANDHIAEYGPWTCDLYDYTAAPITEEDTPR